MLLSEGFYESMPAMCQQLLPVMKMPISEDLGCKSSGTGECLVGGSRLGVECNNRLIEILRELVTEF